MTQRGAMGGPPVQPDGMSPSGARSPSSRPADLWKGYARALCLGVFAGIALWGKPWPSFIIGALALGFVAGLLMETS